MTYGILNSINKKDRLYMLLLKTDVNSEKYAALKATFKQYRETLRSSIKEAKRLYEKKKKNTFISEKKCNIIIIFIKYVTYNSFLETAIMGSAA